MKYKSKKHKEILVVAKSLFWKFGFKRVSVEEICRNAKVSKMTFYRFFPNKLEVAKAVFDMVIDESIADFRQLISSNLPPSEKMRRMLQMKFEGTNDISKEFLMDFYNNPELEVAQYIHKRIAEVWNSVVDDFKQGQRDGWIRNDFKPEIMLMMSQKIMELMNDSNVLAMYSNPQELIMEISNFFTYGITPHD